MKALAIVCKVVGTAWLAIAGLLILAGTIAFGLKNGVTAALSLFSPFNIVNWLAMFLIVAPGIALERLGVRLSKREGAGTAPRPDA